MDRSKDEVVQLIIRGEDEYSAVSDDVRRSLSELAGTIEQTKREVQNLDRALDLTARFREQEAEVARLARAQGEAKVALDALRQANKDANGENVQIAESLARSTAEYNSLRTATNRAQRELDKTSESMRSYGISASEVAQNQDEMRATADQMASTIAELSDEQGRLVETGLQQAATAREQAKAAEEAAAEAEKQRAAAERLEEAQRKSREEDEKKAAATKKLSDEMNEQLRALASGEITWEDYKRRVGNAGRESGLTSKEIASVNREMEEQVTAARRAADSNKQAAAETERVERALTQYRVEMSRLIDSYQRHRISADEFELSELEIRNKLRLTEEQAGKTRKEIGAYTEQIERTPPAHEEAGSSSDKLMAAAKRLGAAYLGLAGAKKAADAVVGTVNVYAEQERAMLGVQKTTDLTAREMQLLEEELKRFSGTISSTSVPALLDIAAAAGRMGVRGVEDILAFTKTTDAMASATGIAAEESAQALAQILNVTKEKLSSVSSLAASIAELGNRTATTEEQIIHFSKRLASDTASVNLTSAEVVGLSATLAELGFMAEGASTVVGRSMRWMADAVSDGGEKMEKLSRYTGMASDEIIKAFGDDKVDLFTKFLAGMEGVQDGGRTINAILEELGLQSDANVRVLGQLATQHERLNENVAASNEAYRKAVAHFQEMALAQTALESSSERLSIRADRLREAMGRAISSSVITHMESAVSSTDELEQSFAGLGDEVADFIDIISDTLRALGGVYDVFSNAGTGAKYLEVAVFGVKTAIDTVNAAINGNVMLVSQMAIAWNKFWGDEEGVKKWEKTYTEALQRVEGAAERNAGRIRTLAGQSSSAFERLSQVYRDNASAVEHLDDEQRALLETIMKEVGYVEGSDSVYRDLTRTLQRVAQAQGKVADEANKSSAAIAQEAALQISLGKSVEEAWETARRVVEERAALAEKEAAQQQESLEKFNDAVKSLGRKTREEINQQAAEFQRMADAGDISAEQLKEAMQAVEKSLEELTESGFKKLGFSIDDLRGNISKSESELITAFEAIAGAGEAGAKEITAALTVLEKKLTSRAAYDEAARLAAQWAANQEGDIQSVEDAIKRLEEQAKSSFDQMFNATKAASTDGELDAIRKKIEALRSAGELSLTEYQELLNQTMVKQHELSSTLGETEESANSLAGALKKAGAAGSDAVSDTSDAAKQAAAAAGSGIAEIVNAFNSRVASLSDNAYAAFQNLRGGVASVADELSELEMSLKRFEEEAAYNARVVSADFSGIGRSLRKIQDDALFVERAFVRQKLAVEGLVEAYDAGTMSAEELVAKTADLDRQFNLLDEQDLQGIRSALSAIQSQTDALTNSLEGTISSLRQELASLQGDAEQVEQLRHAERRLAIEQQLQEARRLGDERSQAAAVEALRLLDETHNLRLQDLRAQQKQQEIQEAKRSAQAPSQQTTKQTPSKMVEVRFAVPGGRNVAASFDSQSDVDRFLSALEQVGATTT